MRAGVSGHGFSRAVTAVSPRGFRRWWKRRASVRRNDVRIFSRFSAGILFVALIAASAFAEQSGPPPAFNEPLGSFFALSVKDLNASSAWYQQKLGFREVHESASPDGKSRAVLLERDGAILELIHHKQATSGTALRKDYKAYLVHGIFKVGFIVQDADHTMQRLKANGVPIANGPFTDDALHMRSFIIRDNEGNYIQFFSKVSG